MMTEDVQDKLSQPNPVFPDGSAQKTPVTEDKPVDEKKEEVSVDEQPREMISLWADGVQKTRAGVVEMLMAYVAQEEMRGHVFDTASNFEQGLRDFSVMAV